MQDDGLSEQERQLEAGLKRLEPVVGLERDAVMFAAGVQAQRRKLWTWRATAGGLAALWLVTVGAMGWIGRPETTTARPQVLAHSDVHKTPATLLAADRRIVKSVGLDEDSSSGFLALLGMDEPMERALSNESSVFDLRRRALIYGVGILPGQSAGDSQRAVSSNKRLDDMAPTYGNSMRNLQGERL